MFKNFKVDKERETLSFTISAKMKNGKQGYELNLQAATVEEMQQFVDNLQIIMKDFQIKDEIDEDEKKTDHKSKWIFIK